MLFVCATFLAVDISQLAIVGVLMSRILVQIGNVIKGQQTVALTASIGASIEEKLQHFRAEAEPNSGTRAIRLRQELQFDNVTLGYDGRAVVENVNLSIPAGSLCSFIGASGGGKTTLVDAVLGLVAPTSGRVLVDGVDLSDADLLAWRQRIGYVPQELVLFNDTVRANIIFGRDNLTEDDVRRALKAAEALDFVEAMPLGLETQVGERGTALSGGQRQRLAIARALVASPRTCWCWMRRQRHSIPRQKRKSAGRCAGLRASAPFSRSRISRASPRSLISWSRCPATRRA